MRKHKKDKKIDSGIPGFTASPHRQGRRLIGDVQRPLLKEDPTSRRLDDFSRSNGYHPSQPLVSGRNGGIGSDPHNKPSMINMNLPGGLEELDNKEKPDKTKKDWEKIGRRVKQTLIGVGVLILIIGGFLGVKSLINLRKVFGSNPSSLKTIVSPASLKTEGDGNINVLLLGIGGVGHDGPDLTDTILLADIDPVNHKVSLLSVPRDLWVQVPSNGSMKLNAVYETGKWKYLGSESDSDTNKQAVQAGFNLDNQIIGGILGIPIKYDVLVDFAAFQQAINTLGGVTVNVPTELYDPTIAWQNNNNPVIAEPGVQTFNGAQALLYVRSRETTSDFARTQRQRAVIIAVKDKALTLGTVSNPVKLAQLTDEFGNNVVTNLSLGDANTLYGLVKGQSDGQIKSIGLADPPNNYVTTSTVDGVSTVIPSAGLYDYSDIQYYVRNTLKDGYIAKENASITVLNGSNQPNAGTNVANTLKSYGYNVTSVGTAPTQSYQKTVLVDLSDGKDPYTDHYLELRLGLKSTTNLPDTSIQPGNANFVIIVGQDEAVNS